MPAKKQSTFIISGKGMTIGVLAILSALAWMFVLGVWVGRGTTPPGLKISTLKEKLEQLVEVSGKNEDTFETGSEIGDKKEDLEFYDTLKRSQPGTEVRRIPIKQESAAKDTGPVEVKKRSVPLKKPAQAVQPVVKAVDPPTADTPFTIQVASIKRIEAADKLVKEFNAKGIPAYHVKADIPGKGIWYRIRVGAFKNKNEAALVVKQLRGMNYNPIVIRQ